MTLPRRRNVALMALVAGALVAATGLAWAQANKERKGDPKGALKGGDPHQRASGVIVKAEDISKGATPGSTVDELGKEGKDPRRTRRLTINTAAVWRDYARDQAPETRVGHTKADAAKGTKSVATQGEPKSEDTLVTVDIGPGTVIETRFRASDDETSAGASTPSDAVAEEKESGKDRKAAGKSAMARPSDLRPGLFVEVDYRHTHATNLAGRVVIIKPIGGPNTPNSEPGEEHKSVKKTNR